MRVVEKRPTDSVLNASGKERFRPVTLAQDVSLLALRIGHDPKLVALVHSSIGHPLFRAWIWGTKSFALAKVMDTILYGRIASLEWLESEPGYSTKRDIAPSVEQWARTLGAKRIVTLVHEEAPWERLTGWSPQSLLIGKEL